MGAGTTELPSCCASLNQRELWGWSFETSKPVTHLLQHDHTPLILPKQFTDWGPDIQNYELMGPILIQTTTGAKKDGA